MSWRVVLDGVPLSGGDAATGLGCLNNPPQGLGLPGLRVEDATYPQRDGVRHFNDWYEPRIITLENVDVCGDGCGCDSGEGLTARQKLKRIVNAWDRRCDDTELVIFTDCDGEGDPEEVGPFGVVGRPRVATYDWRGQTKNKCAVMQLRFDAVDHRMYILDADGTPGSGLEGVVLGPSNNSACRLYDRCYDGDGMCYDVPSGNKTILRTNLIENPSFEYPGSPFLSGPGPALLEITTEDSRPESPGDRSLKITRTDETFQQANNTKDVEASVQYTFAAWVKPPPGSTNVYIRIADSPGFPDGPFDSAIAADNDTWQQLTVTATASATDIGRFRINAPDGVDNFVYVDDVGLSEGTDVVDFSGDTPNDPDNMIWYEWTGEPGSSASNEFTASESNVGPQTVVVSGDLCVDPTIQLHGQLTNPIVENLDSGERIQYRGVILAGDEPVIINTEDGTATQGGASRTHLVVGDFGLDPGENTIRLTSFSTADDGFALVNWRPAVKSA